jgi:PAS domain S-box-containing protein
VSIAARVRDLSLAKQLTLSFALLSLVTTAVATIALTTLGARRMTADLSAKSVHYARLLQKQLEPVVAFDDRLTAREVFESLALDTDIDGLAVYSAQGTLIEGRGVRPASLATGAAVTAGKGHIVTVAGVRSREGPTGRLYVSLTTRQIEREKRRAAWIAAAIAGGLVLLGVALARSVARRVTRRLAGIAAVSTSVAAGNFAQPRLDAEAKDEIGALAQAFNVMVSEVNRLFEERRQLAVTEQARLEQLVAERTGELQQSREQYRLIAESTNAIPFALDLTRGCFTYIGPQALSRLGFSEEQWMQPGFIEILLPRDRNPAARIRFDECDTGSFEMECPVLTPEGHSMELRWVLNCETSDGTKCLRGLILDITDQRRLERELSQAQKLESVGRLSAGVAHEINTPVQFVSDSVHFVRESMGGVVAAVEKYRALQQLAESGAELANAAREAGDAEKSADLAYVMENIPGALNRAIDGLGRVATIVRSMKEFAHPDSRDKVHAELNHAVESTLVVASSEYKYVAEIVTDFGELPPVLCHVGEVNQVVLNLVVNAAHAIADVVADTGAKGTITVRTRFDGDAVEISVGDTGAGIPEEVRERIFDPFFTTKEVGKGSGQGLAIARSVVVDKHGGAIRFETEVGKGTTFYIRLPVAVPTDPAAMQQAAA